MPTEHAIYKYNPSNVRANPRHGQIGIYTRSGLCMVPRSFASSPVLVSFKSSDSHNPPCSMPTTRSMRNRQDWLSMCGDPHNSSMPTPIFPRNRAQPPKKVRFESPDSFDLHNPPGSMMNALAAEQRVSVVRTTSMTDGHCNGLSMYDPGKRGLGAAGPSSDKRNRPWSDPAPDSVASAIGVEDRASRSNAGRKRHGAPSRLSSKARTTKKQCVLPGNEM